MSSKDERICSTYMTYGINNLREVFGRNNIGMSVDNRTSMKLHLCMVCYELETFMIGRPCCCIRRMAVHNRPNLRECLVESTMKQSFLRRLDGSLNHLAIEIGYDEILFTDLIKRDISTFDQHQIRIWNTHADIAPIAHFIPKGVHLLCRMDNLCCIVYNNHCFSPLFKSASISLAQISPNSKSSKFKSKVLNKISGLSPVSKTSFIFLMVSGL